MLTPIAKSIEEAAPEGPSPATTWDVDAWLNAPIVCAFGASQYSNLKNKTLDGFDLFTTLTANLESQTKEGECFTPGRLIDDTSAPKGKNLKDNNVAEMTLLVFDCDKGQSIADATAKLKADGITHFGSTSHSNGATTTDVAETAFSKFLEKRGNAGAPTAADARAFLTEKLFYPPNIVSSVVKPPELQAFQGKRRWLFQHDPLTKFRLIVAMSKPFPLLDETGASSPAKRKQWTLLHKLLSERYGITADPACRNVSRLYYTPRHRRGAVWDSLSHFGIPLNWEPLLEELESAEQTRVAARLTAKPGAPSGSSARVTVESPDYATVNLTQAMTYGLKWLKLADVIEAVAPADDVPRNYDGKLDMRCPFVDDHITNQEPGGFMVSNPGVLSQVQGFHAKCSHAGCDEKGTDRLVYLAGLLDTYPELWIQLEDARNYDAPAGWSLDIVGLRCVLRGSPPYELPTGFFIADDTIFRSGAKDEDSHPTAVCQTFRLVGKASDEHGRGWAKLIEFTDAVGNTKRAPCRRHRHRCQVARSQIVRRWPPCLSEHRS
jgi:hypothetical protein